MLERLLPTYRFCNILCVPPSITHGALFVEGFENHLSTGELSAPIVVPTLTHLTVKIFSGESSNFLHHINSIPAHKPNLPKLHSQHIIHQLPHVVATDFSPLIVTQRGEFSFIGILVNCTALRAVTFDLHSDKLNIVNKVVLENLHGGRLVLSSPIIFLGFFRRGR